MAKKDITIKELEKACEDVLDKVAEQDEAIMKTKKPVAKSKQDAAMARIERVLDRVKDNEELLRTTVALAKTLGDNVTQINNRLRIISTRLGL